ncbi:MAG TPA: hypothetical protein VM262_03940 [Acidimicrobiales bacterium]|nr:hypothetical protein [Acidimicrobiales bacterium]
MNEDGFVGGFEVLPFGLLVFVAGALLLGNAWAVVDGTLAATAAAREATRSYVEAPSSDLAEQAARSAALATIEAHGRDPSRAQVRWEVGPDFTRCARNTIVVEYRVPTFTVPLIGAFGSGVITTSGRHTEVVDPYRSGLAVDGFDAESCRA